MYERKVINNLGAVLCDDVCKLPETMMLSQTWEQFVEVFDWNLALK